MTVYFDRGRQTWRYDFRLRGRRYSGYCIDPDTHEAASSRRAAIAVQEAVRRAAQRQSPDEAAPTSPSEWTLAEGFADWTEKIASRNRNWRTERGRVAELLREFGAGTPLSQITESMAWDYIAWARRQPVRVYLGKKQGVPQWRDTERLRTDSTINRYIAVLRAMLNHAHRQRDPVTKQRRLIDVPDLPDLDEPDDLPNPVRAEHVRAILEHAAPHLYDAIFLAVHTGLRLREIVDLERRQVDIEHARIVMDSRSKSRKGAVIYLNQIALQLVERLVDASAEAGKTHLILYHPAGEAAEPRPIKSLRTAWLAAQKRAGVTPPHRFHDLRGNFATELARRGAHWKTVKGLARHADIRTTLRYIAVVDDDSRAAVERLSDFQGTQAERPPVTRPETAGKSSTRDFHTPMAPKKRKVAK